ncbi:Crooked neck-like protein 1 [Phlyctochytrium planicorne]|nr:Crooked neck-like protein 1 [Phlyctochytrium planicorne]
MAERQSRTSKVKNKNPAPLQITAEQILREASERQEAPVSAPKQKITDIEELNDYRQHKRKGFEDAIRKNRNHVGTWLKYAAWEESQNEMERARSVFERSLEIEHRNQTLWLKYAELEMKHKNINMARNIFDRAVAILPRIDAFWYKYTYMEEMLDNIAGARQVFERWMSWEPVEEAWMAYIKLEKRYKEYGRAREIFQRFISANPQPKNWLKWAKFEESIGHPEHSREIYEKCIETLGESHLDQNIYISFAKFETRVKEIDRARAIYKYALEKLPKGERENLQNVYAQFEKQFGGVEVVEDVIVGKRRVKYEEEIQSNPKDYDTWFDYTRLEEDAGDFDRIRDVYERAIGQAPPIPEKRFWRRYIYLWLFYAVWEEKVAKDLERARSIYKKCLEIIPHKNFTFAKVWLMYAKFQIRRYDLAGTRKTLGMAIGMCPKERIFKGYIELEIRLGEFDRVRQVYQKYLEWNPANCAAWIRYAELEKGLGDLDRCRGIFEVAVGQGLLDMPEVLWKGYIDFETGEGEWSRVRKLYERLLERTRHVKVWVSYANFELVATDNGESIPERLPKSRSIYKRGYDALRIENAREERVVLLESWLSLEKQYGDAESIKNVQGMMPRVVKKRRRIEDEGGNGGAGWEEFFDYIFADDEVEKPNLKLLEVAHAWKEKLGAIESDSESDEESEGSDDDKREEEDDERPKNAVEHELDDSDDEINYAEIPIEEFEDLSDSDEEETLEKAVQSLNERSFFGFTMEQAKSEEPAVTLTKRPEVIDDYIRNYLASKGLFKSLEAFQNEWYEFQQKGKLSPEDVTIVPDVYQKNQELADSLQKLRIDVENYKEIASKARSTYDKLRKERDFHRMHHKRVVQEKNRLINDIKRLKKHYESYEPTLRQLRNRYEMAMKEKMLTKLERDRLIGRLSGLEASGATSVGKLEKGERQANQVPAVPASGGLRDVKPQKDNLKNQQQERIKTSSQQQLQNAPSKKGQIRDAQLPLDDRVNVYQNGSLPSARVERFKQIHVVKGHEMAISAVKFHPKKMILATVSDDKTWKMWAFPSGELIMSGGGHKDWISDCDFHPRGAHLATASGDGTVKLWDFSKGIATLTLSDHTQAVWSCAFHDGGEFLASSSMDHTAKLWDITTGKCRQTFRGHADSVNHVGFIPFTNTLYTCSGDRTVSLWDARTGLCSQTLYGHMNAINCVTFSMAGDNVASSDADGIVKFWDIRSVSETRSLDFGPMACNRLVFDPAGANLAVAGNDGTVKLYSIKDEIRHRDLTNHEDAVQSVAFDRAAQFLVSAGSVQSKYVGTGHADTKKL